MSAKHRRYLYAIGFLIAAFYFAFAAMLLRRARHIRCGGLGIVCLNGLRGVILMAIATV